MYTRIILILGLVLTATKAVSASMNCTDLGAWLAQQSNVSAVTSGVKPRRCELDFDYSSRGGTENGYAARESQKIRVRVGLPLNSLDGGAGGISGGGAWNGKVQNLGGSSLAGAVSDVTAATKAGYVGSSTDGGHTSTEDYRFAVIAKTRSLNLGKIDDFVIESLRQQYQWALRLTETYYGMAAQRNYWNGCSTGGRQGISLALAHGDDFDGFLIGAPALYHSSLQMTTQWPMWVNKHVAGGTLTPEKFKAVNAAAVKACDADDGLVDGLLTRPETCAYSASVNICGRPGAPLNDCLTDAESDAIDRIWDGPRDDAGASLWVPFDRGANPVILSSFGCGSLGILCWAHRDLRYDWRTLAADQFDDEARLVAETVAPYTDVSSTDLQAARDRGAKILMWHGLTDPAIPARQSVKYYESVVNDFGGIDQVTPWFRLFLAPGVNHCAGGTGPQPSKLLAVLENWVEKGVMPDKLVSVSRVGSATRKRPLCPWPTTAVYNGTGDLNSISSFTCNP